MSKCRGHKFPFSRAYFLIRSEVISVQFSGTAETGVISVQFSGTAETGVISVQVERFPGEWSLGSDRVEMRAWSMMHGGREEEVAC